MSVEAEQGTGEQKDFQARSPEEVARELLDTEPVAPPPKTADQIAHEIREGYIRDSQELQGFLEVTPNLDGHYARELALIRDQFAQDGLAIDPITVLPAAEYAEACKIVGQGGDNTLGMRIGGQVLIKEFPQADEVFGPGEYVIANGLHELGHSTARDTYDFITTKEVDGVARTAAVAGQSGFYGAEAATLEDGMPGITGCGDFIEEAYADLTRVRYQERLGKSQAADGRKDGETYPDGTRVRYVGDGVDAPLIDDEMNCVSVPIKYALLAKPVEGGRIRFMAPSNNIAAYALDLLDAHVPGLFETMQASRTDPAARERVVEMVDEVQPGLYQELNRLSYSPKDFTEGLKLVARAVGADRS